MAFRAQVVYRAKVTLALVSSGCIARVVVHLFLSISSVSADSLRCHCGNEGIHLVYFGEASPGVFLSQLSAFYALESQQPASSLLRLRLDVSLLDTVFPVLQYSKIRLWPFWPYSTTGACPTVPAVYDLLALP